MRLLHTSDWHLGQDFHRHDRTFEQQNFLEWLVNTLCETRIDVLLIAGDVYDVANPSASAQRLFYEFLVEAKRRCPGLKTVLVAGNHDSGARLEAPAELLRSLDVHVVGRLQSTAEGVVGSSEFVVPLFDPSVSSQQPFAVCLAIPFLKSADVQWPGDRLSYTEAVVRTYLQVIAHARSRYGRDVPLIALGHLHATGGLSSQDSERRLVIGGEEAVPLAQLATELSYLALGHLHLAQRVGGHEHLRYSGSPLPMSFSELNYPHQVVLVDIAGTGAVEIQSLRVPRPVELIRCPAQPRTLDLVLAELSALELPQVAPSAEPYLEVPVLLNGPTPDLRMRIDQALEGKPVRLTKIAVSRASAPAEGPATSSVQPVGLDNLRQLDPLKIFMDMHERKYRQPADQELLSTFEAALRDVSDLEGGQQ